MSTDNLNDLKSRWDAYRQQRDAAGNPLDGKPDYDLQLYVRFEDREPGCTILRPRNLKKFVDWRGENQELIKKALAEIDTLRKDKGHYSISDVVGHFRHFEPVNQTDPKYRINDHVGPLLARHCIYLNPPLRDFFELRSLNPRRKAAAIMNVLIDDIDIAFALDWDAEEWLEIGHQVRDELLSRFGGEKADVA
jgi:hypothetical protein